ncbi:PREDICTED: uncharacterized protein LOC109222707 [Nicotiana attenuata]|uniref:uncharacterized protein LOC109222707 n=1 Tax=Nicotiana attenuata TaxID=49451 RepID=UPI0009048D64|nr:PREDICTED: uncharacterized protein LOC109222707 [Nicotiana attenuata]
MECVTTVSYSLTLNGGLTKPFPAKRGLRQGDPMSPYLFVIAMEYLQREMSTLAKQKEFRYHPKCKKLGVTHICFADDLLMFCKGDKKSITALQNIFNKFSKASGLQASAEKSSIYIAGVSQHTKEELIQLTGYAEGSIPFKYLGVPLSARKLNIHQCLPLVEKITERIRCWSARMLSYSGRVQLIKSVLFGVQTYWAQIFLIPKKIMKMIETLCRTFLWTGSNEFSRKALIAWDKICQPKSAGGLNVMNIRIWNKAAVLKHLWALAMKKDSLWIKWAHTYYIKRKQIEETPTPKAAAWVVRKIMDARDEVMKIRTDQQRITDILENFVKQGKFHIHKAYIQMQPQFSKVEWKSIHMHSQIHPRFKFHMWLATNQRIATVDRLIKFGIQVQAECIFCGKAEETFEHLYFGCQNTRELWDRILKWLGHTRQIGDWSQELNWMNNIAKKKEYKAEMTVASFAMVMYCIWRERNSMRFNKGRYNIDEVCREVAMHIHIQGRKKIKWKKGLELVNKMP